jgi:imidazolonepropionase-like amidohydrolase
MNKMLGLLATLLVFSSVSGSGQTTTPAGVKAFVGARVFDGSGKPAIENATLVVRNGRVEAVGPASAVKAPAGAQTINLA